MAIQFEQVSYKYPGKSATLGLDDVGLTIEGGKFVAVLGASGSGKSTLMQHMNGILRPSAGRIRTLDVMIGAGERVEQLGQLRKRVGLLFQFPEQQLFAETVEKDIIFGPKNFGMSDADAKKAARAAVETVGLDADEVLERSPFQLSGGQSRKVAIATVLVMNPEVYVLDEPTASLDPVSRRELLQLLHRLCKDQGKTMIVVTHRLDEMLPFADEYIVMEHGKLRFQGTADAMFGDSTMLEDCGIELPPAVQFIQAMSERFGVEFPVAARLNAEEIATRVAGWLKDPKA